MEQLLESQISKAKLEESCQNHTINSAAQIYLYTVYIDFLLLGNITWNSGDKVV